MNNLNLTPALPEIFLAIAISVILLIDLFSKDERRSLTYLLSIAAMGVCGLMTFFGLGNGETSYSFNDMFVSDSMSIILKLFSYLAIALTLVYSRRYAAQRNMVGGFKGGEFYLLALFSLLGQMVMISANHFLVIYIGLEMMSLSLYALVAIRRDHSVSIEAAMKYFVLGALASGFLLYGISMLYGATGSLYLTEVAATIASGVDNKPVLILGLVFIVAGLAFKLGAAPFHMWVPDVYQGAPTAVTLLLGGAPKLATFAITIRLLAEALPTLSGDWQQMLTILAVLSMAVGNITAIMQTNIKRMLAYSTISQMGFMLLGLLSGVVVTADGTLTNGYGAALFYALTYVLTTLGVFGMIMLLSRPDLRLKTLMISKD